ncbi:Hypothetical protein R9X50_00006300 [Acrodontium crateriforme]|uniref:DASH complex subunit ASK1 n=1 Tax=Acrodontium crateriforme TaxID=150365 RepID=A0AAQ3LY25_9PEZI|nr:Hypothetical protein R9X50_00006300 [Acrodontium crateriforme]
MSRPAPARPLTLTEELEKLEQSITLTLQEIDGNFSKAHRIVTTSILPLVEQYAKHSADVWDGSKFWKQFFEASANVSLSGYEEATLTEDATQNEDTSASLQTPTDHGEHAPLNVDHEEIDDDEEFTVDSPTQVTGLQTTPKLSPANKGKNVAGYTPPPRSAGRFTSPSPRKYTGKNSFAMGSPDEPSTPRPRQAQPQSSPFEPESASAPSAFRNQPTNNDPLMHRVLDKNYRIQATPHTQRRERHQTFPRATPATATKKALWDDSPQSSPEMAPPQLRSDLFSPAKTAPRTPGISVLTPARHRITTTQTSTGRTLFGTEDKTYAATQATARANHQAFSSPDHDLYDSDEDTFDISPPKTIQFHVPASRLVQTPAHEASKRIVEDLLLTAGADDTDELDDFEGDFEIDMGEGMSPSIVKGKFTMDDTF